MLRVELRRSEFTLSGVCVTCGATYVVEKVECILFMGDRQIGNVCEACLKKGSGKLSMVLRKQAETLRQRAKVLDELSSHSIDCPTWNEYLEAIEDKDRESEKLNRDEEDRPLMIQSRVFLIGEGIVPREAIEGLSSEHLRMFLTELDISKWPIEIHHLKKYTEIEIDDSYLFRIDEGM